MSKANLINSSKFLNTSVSAMSGSNISNDQQQSTTQNVASSPTVTISQQQQQITPSSVISNEIQANLVQPVAESQINYELPPMSELPSYTEALKLKKMEMENNDGIIPTTIPPSYYTSTNPNANHLDETRIVIDPADLRAIHEATESVLSDQEVGSECMFLSAFMISFFFNWVGFFASVCLLPNAAGKYGALSGLGLSIAKWVTMIKVSILFLNHNLI